MKTKESVESFLVIKSKCTKGLLQDVSIVKQQKKAKFQFSNNSERTLSYLKNLISMILKKSSCFLGCGLGIHFPAILFA